MEIKAAVQVKIDQDRWIVQIKEGLRVNGEQEVENEDCVCVFGVPKELLAVKPEAYIPQCVSIGPYHHGKSQLYETERYKVAAARSFQKRIAGDFKFESVVEEVKMYGWQIRRCYHKYLDYNDEFLAWLMALDASFVLECLQFYVKQADKASPLVSSEEKQLGRVLDPSSRSATHNAIMRDLMMLENQLPLLLLQKLLEMQLGSKEKAQERLSELVCLACEKLSPFMFKMPESSRLLIKERGHILEVLYYSIVPAPATDGTCPKENKEETEALQDIADIARALNVGWTAVSSLNVGPVRRLTALYGRLLKGSVVQFVMKLPIRFLSILGNLPILRSFKGKVTPLFAGSAADRDKKDGDGGISYAETPTRDELEIPSVSDLYSAGVKFLPTDGDLTTICFDWRTATLYLSKLKLDSNSEVVLKNMLAFEASATPGALIFTRYTDFMNGIIDKDEDVRLLVNSNIICNRLANEGEVASLCNGMGKCMMLTEVKYLDKVIADVNQYYYSRWRVAVMEFFKKYIFGSWRCLTLLATGIFLLLTCLEAFCSVYDCKEWSIETSFLHG